MFTDTYLPTRDGVVSSILTTTGWLKRMGHEVIIFAPEPADEREMERGVYYFRSVEFKKYTDYRIPLFPTNKCEILKKLDVDVLHSQGLMFMALRSMFAGRTLKKPVVLSFHTMVTDALRYYADLPLPLWMMEKLLWTYLRQLLERADVVIVPTRSVGEELRRRAPGMSRIEVIPTGVDCERFGPHVDGSGVREKYGLNGKRVILHVGRIAWEKNIELVLESLAILRQRADDLMLLIAGKGPAEEHLRRRAAELGVEKEVIFTGFVPDEDLPSYYAACDAFVLASKFETQGLVVLEAMATGKPVACIDYRATAEIVEDGVDGFLFSDGPESCAEAIAKALESPEELGRSARRKAERYSVREGVERLIDLYEYAIESKKRAMMPSGHRGEP